MGGYKSRVLRVDLSRSEFSEESLSHEFIHGWVGGRGFGIKMLYDDLTPGIDPFGEDNELIFIAGPLAGTNAQSFGRWKVFSNHRLPVDISSLAVEGVLLRR